MDVFSCAQILGRLLKIRVIIESRNFIWGRGYWQMLGYVKYWPLILEVMLLGGYLSISELLFSH